MTENPPNPKKIQLLLRGTPRSDKPLPYVLQIPTRAVATLKVDPFINERVVITKEVYELGGASRDAAAPAIAATVDARDVLALETVDGFTLFIRADKLAEDLARIDPQVADGGVVQLHSLRDRSAATRGISDWLLTRVSVLEIKPDDIVAIALEKANEWLGGPAKHPARTLAELSLSWLGTKALMWAIEQRLAAPPGLYRWLDAQDQAAELQVVSDQRLQQDAAHGPLLLFIHGIGSSTAGTFGDLHKAAAVAEWQPLRSRFGERIYAFEHRTFSESPIENALQLAKALPAGARLNVVAHSRGGLVSDLLCMTGVSDSLISGFRRREGSEEAEADGHDQQQLRELRAELEQKNFRIERYLRVASPARGTRLASGNFDAFLSCLLTLIGLVPALQANPLYSAIKRIVLEIARNRTKPNLVPGIEAMLPESPLGALLANAALQQGAQLAVIAGDIEGGGMLKRLGVLFTDFVFFDDLDNDLVVDTDSMYAGLARSGQARYLFEQGPEVSHFRYFDNRQSRRALKDWLTVSEPEQASEFEPIPGELPEATSAPQPDQLRAARSRRGADSSAKAMPQVLLIPDFMASQLSVGTDRVWFEFSKIASGGLPNIRWDARDVTAEKLLDVSYGNLCRHLAATHEVHPFPYDWRKSLVDAAERLADRVLALLGTTEQPLRLLAHGMGGLVVRALIVKRRDVWDRLVERDGARLVMLGTANHGSHCMVQTLLGKADGIRQLARIDQTAKLQGILDMMAEFRGALELLPSPHFIDSGGAAVDYFQVSVWQDFKARNKDPWFGDQIAATPSAAALSAARKLWNETLADDNLPNLDKIEYVHGCAANTPCGVVEEGGRLKIIATPEGDGSVTWASGRLPGVTQDWYMQAEHGELADKEQYFPALVDLLACGATDRLLSSAPAVRAAERLISYDAGPVPYPSAEEAVRSLLGARPRRMYRRNARGQLLRVSCRAMDLRFAQLPILCGHYEGDVISGAEAQIDRNLVDGALTSREHLGLYAGPIGTAAVVLLGQNEQERLRGSSRGAVIVGLGAFGELTTKTLVAAVRTGVLRYLLHIVDQQFAAGGATEATPREVGLASLLIGYNSTTNVSIEDSVAAIVRGVCEANRQFEDAMRLPLQVGKVELVELFQDTAIAAARALPRVAQRLAAELSRLDARIEAAAELEQGDGARSRLDVSAGATYWPRLIVSNADFTDDMPPAYPATALAERLRFVLLSQRARAENVVQQRQPGLIENLVGKAIGVSSYQPDLSRTLFQLMVPLSFKEAAQQTDRLVLVLDGYTANLPWEMLVAEDQPLALQTRMVRQLSSTRFRSRVRYALERTAYVVGNPDTNGYYRAFGEPGQAAEQLPSLDGADQEARVVAAALEAGGYQVEKAFSGSPALDVMNKLFKRPYRILHIAAHGIYALKTRDGTERSGVILSDGILLTAAEIGQMEIVPDFVFLNCCFAGTIDRGPIAFNRLAYSVARELIEMGVRAIVAAGWAVNDEAASTFAQTLYEGLLGQGLPFGEAVFEARKETYQRHPAYNTWGAYQAYGDPGFLLDPGGHRAHSGALWKPVSPLELIGHLNAVRIDASAPHRGALSRQNKELAKQVDKLTSDSPKSWLELPDVQYALGRVYAELGDDYFERARAAYQRAIEASGGDSGAPVCAIEQLANLEARQGESSSDPNLIERAINRLQSLISLSAGGDNGAPPIPGNSERNALLGSAFKRKALVLARDAKPQQWVKVREALEQSRDWYQRGEGGETGFEPYAALNRLALDVVLDSPAKPAGQAAPAIALARRCAASARARFASSGDFFDAIVPAEALLIERLLDGSLPEYEQELGDAYRQAGEKVASSARAFASVTAQLRTLATLLALRGDAEQDERVRDYAAVLKRMADSVELSGASAIPRRKASADIASSHAASSASHDNTKAKTKLKSGARPAAGVVPEAAPKPAPAKANKQARRRKNK
jgi:CHAT domain-containing protein